jgi:inosine/xanthosine triphosphate pyrophosphatase family protein/diadenosine tetraphosphate (Ap4A) HIT family hydrolase
MLTLVTSNSAKYAPFSADLEKLRIRMEGPPQALPEIQSLNFTETLTAKARAAAALFGRPVIVDDTGLVLEAYAPFPGPLTATVLRSLGAGGLRRLLAKNSDRAVMECHLGIWINGALRQWTGTLKGWIDPNRPHKDERMLLSDLFVLDPAEPGGESTIGQALLPHRTRAIAALKNDAFDLHLEIAALENREEPSSPSYSFDCPFCAELENPGRSLFAELAGGRLKNRIVYQDEDFVVMPPLGEFMEGGLLLLTREHVRSLSLLHPARFEKLERLLHAIRLALQKRWGVAPLIFEHGPAPQWGKGVCCVDHAHLNIFPAAAAVFPHLAQRMNFPVSELSELQKLRHAEFGYLFVQENDGARRVYDGKDVPTQLVRRIITSQIGLADRWHWRDYLGLDELAATYEALKGQIRP